MKKINTDTVLVIGGSGFLGLNIVQNLLKKKFRVTIFDKKDCYLKKNSLKFIKSDLLNFKLLEKHIKCNKLIYHLAAISDIGAASKNKSQTFNVNYLLTKKIVDLCVKYKTKRFIYASTVYSNSLKGSYYGKSKRMSEDYIIKKKKLNFTIIKYGSLYGPNAQSWNSITQFINSIKKKNEIRFNGTGEEVREYIHVEDASNISISILKKIYNKRCITITGNRSIKIKDLFLMLKEISGKNVKIFYKKKTTDHYIYTPYSSYIKKNIENRNIFLNEYIDLGQGLSELF
jgi:UDP-glucose 4-epimerase